MNVPLEKATTDLVALINQVQKGETVTIERDGTPVAQIVRPSASVRARTFGVWEGA